MKNKDLCVPATAMAQEDGTAAPAVGEEITVTVMGKVSKIEDGEVYVTPMTANGVPLKDMAGKEYEKEDEGPSRATLEKWATDSGMAEG
jgi:hypothetical protein